jgi:pSer/pThr/pTyr-binding forkhead associated (FHA) protein
MAIDVKLTVAQGRTRTREVKLRSAETIIGRRSGCDLRIASAEVSRRHCRLCYQDGLLTVEDLDSVNGTFLNGQRVTSRHLIRPGDRLQVGPLTFEVDYNLSQAPKGKTAPDAEELEPEIIEAPAEEAEVFDLEEAPADDEDNYTVMLDVDEADIGHLPEGNDFRDFLSQLEE